MKTMTATKASKEFGRFIDTVQHEPVVIMKQNRPMAVAISMQDAEEFMNFKVETGIQRGLEDVKAGRYEEMTPENTAARLVEFKARLQK